MGNRSEDKSLSSSRCHLNSCSWGLERAAGVGVEWAKKKQ